MKYLLATFLVGIVTIMLYSATEKNEHAAIDGSSKIVNAQMSAISNWSNNVVNGGGYDSFDTSGIDAAKAQARKGMDRANHQGENILLSIPIVLLLGAGILFLILKTSSRDSR